MPVVRIPDFADVSAGGTVDRYFVRGVLYGFWRDPSNCEVAHVHMPDRGVDDYRSARSTASRSGELARMYSRLVLIGRGAARRRGRLLVECQLFSSRAPGLPAGVLGRINRRALWQSAAVGSRGAVQGNSRARRHGIGRRKNDGDGRRFYGFARNLSRSEEHTSALQ